MRSASAKRRGRQITNLDRDDSGELRNDQKRISLAAKQTDAPDENGDGQYGWDKNCDLQSHSKPRSEKETSKGQRHSGHDRGEPLTGR